MPARKEVACRRLGVWRVLMMTGMSASRMITVTVRSGRTRGDVGLDGEDSSEDCYADGAAQLAGGAEDAAGGAGEGSETWSMIIAVIGGTVRDPPTPTGTMRAATMVGPA